MWLCRQSRGNKFKQSFAEANCFKSLAMSAIEQSTKSIKKRKSTGNAQPSRKRLKSQHNVDDLPWKTVSRPSETGLEGDDGILELEEVDGVEVIYENTEGGRVVKFSVSQVNIRNLAFFLCFYQLLHETSIESKSDDRKLAPLLAVSPKTSESSSVALKIVQVEPFDCKRGQSF